MNLQSLIQNIDTTAKVASHAPAPKAQKPVEKTAGDAGSALSSAINDAMKSVGTTKVAAEAPLAADTAKLASDVLGLDKEADLKHAENMGRAFANGAAAQMDLIKQASANLLGEKLAAEGITEEEIALVKMARQDPRAFLAEVQRGLNDGAADSEKQAADTYGQVHDELVRGIHKTASVHFVEGYAKADAVLAKLAAKQGA